MTRAPGIYRCPRCRHTVVLLVVGRALCLPCGVPMKRLPGEPPAELPEPTPHQRSVKA